MKFCVVCARLKVQKIDALLQPLNSQNRSCFGALRIPSTSSLDLIHHGTPLATVLGESVPLPLQTRCVAYSTTLFRVECWVRPPLQGHPLGLNPSALYPVPTGAYGIVFGAISSLISSYTILQMAKRRFLRSRPVMNPAKGISTMSLEPRLCRLRGCSLCMEGGGTHPRDILHTGLWWNGSTFVRCRIIPL